ncbi:transglutaminase domain-containing protein [Micromonospora endolithica]|uniref:Transglutaminase domain-containing protein n=1 Tax=Micromonospora endolithica TaxID=230091 RepID=A0A3A9ZSK7_9ACTN|nr:transglutaminase domain-containing protein [Micromonospora endolithica]RKN51175.1 transglutaminase domain-containing protein [Micromonospora endolithica]TWJ22382.1 transglutaminase superfamily protein [Micromonospora endolithica]
MDIDDYRTHSPLSDPRRHAALLDAVPADIATVAATARNVIVHYRAGGVDLPVDRQREVDLRWVDRILDTDQSRAPLPLAAARPAADRVAGCCRDHTLLSVGVLRQHGVPARSRVGFASYFKPGWHHDHVLVEYWNGDRWVWADPELDPADRRAFDGYDIDPAAGHFDSAARVWSAYRAGTVDPEVYGVDEGLPIRGAWFIHNYVLLELAHRQKDELLLWDAFGAMTEDIAQADLALVDGVAALLLAADDGDPAAEKELADRYAADDRLRPGTSIRSISPVTDTPVTVDLRR